MATNVIPEGFRIESTAEGLPPGFRVEEKAITQLLEEPEQYNLGELGSSPVDLREMGRNAPQSAMNVVEDLTAPIFRPVEFAQGVGTMAAGGFEKMMAEQMESIRSLAGAEDVEIPTEVWDSLWAPYKEKYKDFNSLKRATEQDPFGVARDIIGLIGGAGMAANAARKGAAVGTPEGLPIKLYESSAKFSTTIPDLERAKMVRALLEEDIPITAKGVDKVNNIIKDTNARIDDIIAQADAQGKTVTKTSVLRNIGKLRKELSNKIDSQRDLKIMNGIVRRFLDEVNQSGKANYTISELQEFKKDAYSKITDFSKEKGNKRKTKDKVFRAISEEAKELIEQQAPGVKPENIRQGPLLGIKKDLRRVAQRIENNNMISLRDPIEMGAAAWIADMLLGMPGLGVAIGTTTAILQKPGVKSKLARQIWKLKKDNPTMSNRAMVETAYITIPAIISEMQVEEQQAQIAQQRVETIEGLEAQAMP